ncbi:transposase [Streptomyces phaeochromogenes]|uniref:transposase n=1 Tax=Streptomyces phaeochromogenes TaxID=1923 RepID=UPI0033FDFED0
MGVEEPLLPPWPARAPGAVVDRLCLQGILHVLHNDTWPGNSCRWSRGFGSGQTCRLRRERWQQAGVFDRLHRILLAELNTAGQLDWSRACVDSSPVHAKERGVPTPFRRRSTGARQAANTT